MFAQIGGNATGNAAFRQQFEKNSIDCRMRLQTIAIWADLSSGRGRIAVLQVRDVFPDRVTGAGIGRPATEYANGKHPATVAIAIDCTILQSIAVSLFDSYN